MSGTTKINGLSINLDESTYLSIQIDNYFALAQGAEFIGCRAFFLPRQAKTVL